MKIKEEKEKIRVIHKEDLRGDNNLPDHITVGSLVEEDIIYNEDCLEVVKRLPDESIDLIYIDPPFNSGNDYKIYNDKWDKIENYIEWMRPRVEELYRVLKPTGSFYLHCDWHASHYLKVMMDDIFGKNNFRNEIVWRIGWISGFKTQKRGWIRNHDTIFYYVKSKEFVFNKEYIPYPEDYIRRDGKKPTGKGIAIEDTWNCHSTDRLNSIMIMSFSKEKLGYPTQKPEALLERIIKASSNKGDVVLDAFCGCGTTLVVAQKLGRNWIGIDISPTAVELTNKRLAREDTLFNMEVN